MTILSHRDEDLHEGDGIAHIDPGADRNLKARLKRHLDAHARGELPELGLIADEIESADAGIRQAQQHRAAVREYAITIAKQYEERGVSKTVIAKKLRIHYRTLLDWLAYGRARGGTGGE